jgi:hypothetical protein
MIAAEPQWAMLCWAIIPVGFRLKFATQILRRDKWVSSKSGAALLVGKALKIRSNDGSKHNSRHFSMFPIVQTISKLVLLAKRSCQSPEGKLGAAEAVWSL